jgi:RNase P protein component
MAKAMTEVGVRTEDRPEAIRRAVEEMGELLIEKNRARDRIRLLVRRVHNELNIPPGDFVMGVRLHSLAERRKQQTVDNLREIMFALGNGLPNIAPPVTSPPTRTARFTRDAVRDSVELPVSKRDLIVQILTTQGPMTAAELKTRLGDKIEVGPHLSQLKGLGRVQHQGTQWSVP